MKLPRSLMVGMLASSVLAVLAAAGWFGWWWVTWPERTAREFVEFLRTGKADEARAMMGDDLKVRPVKRPLVPVPRNWSDVQPEATSPRDLLFCTRRFRVSNHGDPCANEFVFTVERGSIVEPWETVSWFKTTLLENGRTEFSWLSTSKDVQ